LVGEPEGKRPFGRVRHRWEDNVKVDLKGMGGRVRNGSRKIPLAGSCGHGNKPSGFVKKRGIS
jgi:hypothetical protein